MKIAIPVNEESGEQTVCVSFGRAPYFLFVETHSQTSQTLPNPAVESEGGAGVQAAQFVADQHAEALITVRGGENAAQVLLAAQIAVYRASGKSAKENLSALEEGKLAILDTFHAGFLHHQ